MRAACIPEDEKWLHEKPEILSSVRRGDFGEDPTLRPLSRQEMEKIRSEEFEERVSCREISEFVEEKIKHVIDQFIKEKNNETN